MIIEKVFQYVDEVSPWADDTPAEVVFCCARKWLLEQDLPSAQPIIYRLAGQSGSGKTTQLLPMVLDFEKGQGNDVFVVAVRGFYKLHPRFAEFETTLEKSELRERTNGFSLKCLAVALGLVMERGVCVVLDMTVLDPVFEEYFDSLVKKHGYEARYHVMGVPKQQSDDFIAKRKGGTGAEAGRAVTTETADYFYDVLPKGLAFLASVDNKSTATVWTAYDKQPVYVGGLGGVVKEIKNARSKVKELIFSEQELRDAKVEFLKKTNSAK